MVKWNSSQLLDFLSSNLIVESKMEDEQKSKLYYKDAKYCFDKFKSNSFKRTEFSVKELEKIGIKNIKYPLYVIMADPDGEYSKIFYDNTNLGGFLDFDSKINSFYIAILKRQDCKTYEDFLVFFFMSLLIFYNTNLFKILNLFLFLGVLKVFQAVISTNAKVNIVLSKITKKLGKI